MTVLENFQSVQAAVARARAKAPQGRQDVVLVAVSKTYGADHIRPVLEDGHRVFGENRVQEAMQKWPGLRDTFPGIELHLIGPLQSNKAAQAVATFDVIQTVDRLKIAEALAAEIRKQGKHPRLFVQVNTGEEPQKAGIAPQELPDFLDRLKNGLGLSVQGLMCIPPVEEPPSKHFALLAAMARTHGLEYLSMGMSSDFEEAIAHGATHVRVGSAIFGSRS